VVVVVVVVAVQHILAGHSAGSLLMGVAAHNVSVLGSGAVYALPPHSYSK